MNSLKTITIDAADKTLGRVASQAAYYLQGKNQANYDRRNLPDKILILNASKIRFSGNKFKTKKYYKHTGYLGHLKEIKMESIWKKNPFFVIKKTIAGMLPKNKLRPKRLKLIEIKK